MPKAYVINAIQMGRGKRIQASTPDSPVVTDLSAKEFNRLEAMGTVREPTEKEIKMAALDAVPDAEEVDEEEETEETEEDDEDALRARYEKIFDAKPGNMKPETIKAKIAEAEGDDSLGV